MWKELESLGIWEMKTPGKDQYHKKTLIKIQDYYNYYIRCGDKENVIVIKRTEGLKEKRYRKIQKIFFRAFFKRK